MGLFSHFFEDYFEVGHGSEWVVRVPVAFTDPCSRKSKTQGAWISNSEYVWLGHTELSVFVSRHVPRRGHSV